MLHSDHSTRPSNGRCHWVLKILPFDGRVLHGFSKLPLVNGCFISEFTCKPDISPRVVVQNAREQLLVTGSSGCVWEVLSLSKHWKRASVSGQRYVDKTL